MSSTPGNRSAGYESNLLEILAVRGAVGDKGRNHMEGTDQRDFEVFADKMSIKESA